MVIAAPNSAAELAGIIMSTIAETSRHMQSLNTLMPVRGIGRSYGSTDWTLPAAAWTKQQ